MAAYTALNRCENRTSRKQHEGRTERDNVKYLGSDVRYTLYGQKINKEIREVNINNLR
jgi:hypothetical protein